MSPAGEALDPALILDDWINRVANLPEEIRFLQDEIADKDRNYNECIRVIEDRDGRIQKFIKANGSHENNPREENYRKVIAENFDKAEQLADEKILLTQKMQAAMDRHIRQLDMQIKQLYDRNEPGFTDPDDVPSLLRPSAANHTAPTIRSVYSPARMSLNGRRKDATPTPSASAVAAAAAAAHGVSVTPGAGRGSNHPQVRQTQTHQGHSASAPASPAATMILSRQAREASAGPGNGPGKRVPRTSSSLSNAPTTSSGLARHSSLGPGTPKSHHQTPMGAQRAGSVPRATTKGPGSGPGRKAGTPSVSSGLAAAAAAAAGSGPGRKKSSGPGGGAALKNISRVKRNPKNSAASSTAESELSEADSASESNTSSRRGTPARSSSQGGAGSGSGSGSGAANGNGGGSGNAAGGNNGGDKEGSSQPQLKRERDSLGGISSSISTRPASGHHSGPGGSGGAVGRSGGAATKHAPGGSRNAGVAPSSDDRMDVDDDEAGDDRKYCLCQNVSFGDMVACDNEDCPFEWFHWTCVGLKSEPNGTWYCPVCKEKMNRGDDVNTGSGGVSSTGGHSIPIGTRKGK